MMEISEMQKASKKIIIIQSIALIILLIMSYIAYPHIWQNFDCNNDIGKLTCKEATFDKYFAVLFIPAFQLFMIIIYLLFPLRKTEKYSTSPKVNRILKMHYGSAIFFVITYPFLLSFILMTKEMYDNYADNISTVFFIIFSLFVLYMANMTAKMNKSLLYGFVTPWNIKSELVWEKTQRFMGFTLTIVAVLCFIGAFVWRLIDYPNLVPIIFFGGLIIAYIISFFLSYYLYQQEQHYKKLQEGEEASD